MAPVIARSLSRLSRDSLIDLCLKWTRSSISTPYLATNRNLLESNEEDYRHEPAENVALLRKFYEELKVAGNDQDGLSKQDIIDRIVDGDWRRGLSLQQLADIDFACLEQNDTALRWSALGLVPFKSSEDLEAIHPAKRRKLSQSTTQRSHYPTVSPSNFVANLKAHVDPLVKAHYTLHRLSPPSNLVVLRLYIVPNTPFAPVGSNVPRNVRQATDSGRVMYIALPDSCPYIYISLSGSTGSSLASKAGNNKGVSKVKIDITAIKRIILESIPKALSKPQERWSLETTKLTCRSLKSISLLKGNGRPGTAGGCYSKFSEEYDWKPNVALATVQTQQPQVLSQQTEMEQPPITVTQAEQTQKQTPKSDPKSRHEAKVSIRFGGMTDKSHAKLDRVHVTINNLLCEPATSKYNSSTASTNQPSRKSKRKRRSLEDIEAGRDIPTEVETKPEPVQISLNFSGADVFRGLKALALIDGGKYVDLDRLPSWMTGEKGLSSLVI